MGEVTVNPIHNVHKKYRTMNLVNPYIFVTAPVVTYNTYIGGVASTISTPALLAAKFTNYPSGTAFSDANITNFTIVGDEIRCFIAVPYNNGLFDNGGTSLGCTYYKDNDGWIRNVGYVRSYPNLHTYYHPNATYMEYYGRNCPLLDMAYFPNITSIPHVGFYGFMENKQAGLKCKIYIPLATTLVTPSTGAIFTAGGANALTTIYCHPSLATNNGGAPDNDIATAISLGATVRYVTNFTAPSPITDLTAGTVYASAVQLNFTAPSSTNAIDYYEVWIDGALTEQRITASGQYVTLLTASTTYSIELKPVDIYFNHSSSNILSQTTASTYDVASANIVSSYQLEGNANDSVGANHGTATAVTYESGLVGQRGVFNGTTSKISCTNNANLQLSVVSIACISKSGVANTGNRALMWKRSAYGMYLASNILTTYSYATPIGNKSTGFNVGDNLNHVIIMTQNSGVTNGTKFYVDGVFIYETTVAVLNQSSALEIGADATISYMNGNIDEATVWNSILTPIQVSEITSKLRAGLHLT